MYDVCRLLFSRQFLRYLLCSACVVYPLFVNGQALPSNTPPLFSPVPGYPSTFPTTPSANDNRYGRVGSAADSEIGRDRLYRGVTPANDASFTRYGRSTVPRQQAVAALARFARRGIPVLSTAIALKELLRDSGLTESPAPDVTNYTINEEGLTCPPVTFAMARYALGSVCTNNGVDIPTVGYVCRIRNGVANSGIVCANGQTSYLYEEGAVPFTSGRPASDQEIEQRIESSPRLPEIVRELDRNPHPDADKIPWSPERVVLPEPVKLPDRVTTRPDGSREVIKERLIPRDDGRGGITWDREIVTEGDAPPNTQSNPGDVTVTTPLSTTTAAEKPPDKDLCEKNPGILACADLDTPEIPIPKVTKNVTFEPSFVFGDGQCPSDKTMVLRGQVVKVFDWTSACGYLISYVRPLIITLSTFAAFFILVGVRTDL